MQSFPSCIGYSSLQAVVAAKAQPHFVLFALVSTVIGFFKSHLPVLLQVAGPADGEMVHFTSTNRTIHLLLTFGFNLICTIQIKVLEF
jgi:hypothetical protein